MPRGPAATWAGRSAATSAMCTPSRQWPLSSRSSEIASSKSRASAGSIVMMVRPVRSTRSPSCVGSKRSACWRAASSTSSGNASGRPYSRMIDSVSTPGVPRGPSTSMITASPSLCVRGKSHHFDHDLVVGPHVSWHRDRRPESAGRKTLPSTCTSGTSPRGL